MHWFVSISCMIINFFKKQDSDFFLRICSYLCSSGYSQENWPVVDGWSLCCHCIIIFVFLYCVLHVHWIVFVFFILTSPSESIGIFCSLEIYLLDYLQWELVKFGVDSQMG